MSRRAAFMLKTRRAWGTGSYRKRGQSFEVRWYQQGEARSKTVCTEELAIELLRSLRKRDTRLVPVHPGIGP